MARPSRQQWDKLLDLVAADKELLNGEFVAAGGVVRTAKKWDDIDVEVNAVPGATTTKTGEQWKAAFIGLRGRARRTCREMASYMQGTGGGPDVDVAGLQLSEIHRRVINLTGMTAAVGTQCPDPLLLQLQRNQARQVNEEDIAQAADAAISVPDADQLLAQFMLHGAEVPAHPPLAVGEVLPAPPAAQAAPPVVQAAPPVVEAAPPVVEAAPPVVEAAPPVVQPEQQDFLTVYQLLPDGKMIELSNSDLFDESVFTPNTPKVWHDEARPEVICIGSSDEEPTSVAVKDEDDLSDCTPLADTPVRPKREKVLHTPPSGSGLTPAFKRRLERMANSTKLDGDVAVEDIKLLLRNNTQVMEEVTRVLRGLDM